MGCGQRGLCRGWAGGCCLRVCALEGEESRVPPPAAGDEAARSSAGAAPYLKTKFICVTP